MLITEQPHSKFQPGLLVLGIFTLGFLSSAGILYALDPSGNNDSVRHTPVITTSQENSEPASQDTKTEPDSSSNMPQEDKVQTSSSQAVERETQPTLEPTPHEAPSREIPREPTPEVTTPSEQPEDTTTTTRRSSRRHKPILELFELFRIEASGFLGVRV